MPQESTDRMSNREKKGKDNSGSHSMPHGFVSINLGCMFARVGIVMIREPLEMAVKNYLFKERYFTSRHSMVKALPSNLVKSPMAMEK